jgi:hypothetical protein
VRQALFCGYAIRFTTNSGSFLLDDWRNPGLIAIYQNEADARSQIMRLAATQQRCPWVRYTFEEVFN